MAKQSIESGEILHATSERVQELEVVIKGSFIATWGNVTIELPYGSIIGLFETPGEKYRFDYEAKEDSMVVSYSYHGEDNIRALIRTNPQITPLITKSVLICLQGLFEKTAQNIEACKELADILGAELKNKYDIKSWRNEYFRAVAKVINLKDIKFCTGTILYAYEYMQDLSPMLAELLEQKSEFDLQVNLRGEEEEASDSGAAAEEDPYTGEEDSGVSDEDIDGLVEESGKTGENPGPAVNVKEKFDNALDEILEYSGIDEGSAESFRTLIATYSGLSDRTATDDNTRRTRRQISEAFYDLYEGVFFHSILDKEIPLVIKMFLYYGFIDEGLAGAENTQALANLAASYEPDPEGNVVTAYEWLKLIFNGKVEPSKNEFDMEWPKYLKQQADDGEIKREDIKRLTNDNKAKVSFEIHNFMKLGSRITYGRVTTFVPVFTEESAVRKPADCVTTHSAVHDALNMVRRIDYSCFTRQIVYSNQEVGVTREFIDTEILPYIILMPVGGTRSGLWQEISGALRNTPGRMMMPMFLDKDASTHVLRLAGEFRWEMCRREQGVHWNDVTVPSLTSMFCDYLQFYRKNHDLSPDLREKIKAQLQASRNSSKAVFVADYMNYVVYESAGSLRINKVSRDIIFRFCPFSKEIRDRLSTSSPAYQKLIERYDIKLAQKLRLMEIVYSKIEKTGSAIPAEIRQQRDFLDN